MKTDTTSTGRTVAPKRLLAVGRKINGTWEVRTFMRTAAGNGRRTFWEGQDSRGQRRR